MTRRRWILAVIATTLVVVATVAIRQWKLASDAGGQKPAEPFRIAGNLYYVGANDIAAFLLTSPQGHILIDGGYPLTPPLILASVAKLGFSARDIRVLLNSEPHVDHAGGLARIQQVTGAQLWASEPSARTIAAGGDDPDLMLPLRLLARLKVIGYPAARVDRVFKDGDTLRLGAIAIVAHVTGGHTRGCTTFTFTVQDRGRDLRVVSACSLQWGEELAYDGAEADLEKTFAFLRALPADIWVTSHARLFGRYRKYLESRSSADPVQPFIDPAGYRAYIDSGEARYRRRAAR